MADATDPAKGASENSSPGVEAGSSTAIQDKGPVPAAPAAIGPQSSELAKDLPLTYVAGRALTDRALGTLLLLVTFFLGSCAIVNADFWMHLASGRLLAQGDYQFGVDPFAYTTRDVSWINHSWLYDWLVYGLYNLVGGAGLVVVKAMLLVGLALVLLQIRKRDLGLGVPSACIGLAVLVMSPRFLLLPVFVSFFFLGLTLYLLTRGNWRQGPEMPAGDETITPRIARADGTARHLWLLPPLFVLWVNLDAWFILGPLAVALYLLGVCVQRWTGATPDVKPGTLGLVLLVGLAACLLNPHHYLALALPPELAYLVVQATDWLERAVGISLGLPSWMVSGGRTIQALRAHDTPLYFWLSPLSAQYRNFATLGNNVAGWAYFPFLVLGLASFVLPMAMGGKKLPWPRLVLCAFFALGSLLQVRLIPFFAIVAGPLVVLNIQDNLLIAGSASRRTHDSWTVVGRLGAGLALVVLLALAWPGWLHGPIGDYAAPRRVAWSLNIDPSLHRAALKLGDLHKQGVVHRGFAFSPDLASYCAWFAPDVKSFFDHRYALFAQTAESFAIVRRALSVGARDDGEFEGNVRRPVFTDWEQLAAEHDMDYLVLTNVNVAFTNFKRLLERLWMDPDHWPFLHGDRTLIFGWTHGKQPDRFARARLPLKAMAFGLVAADERPAQEGTELPEAERGFWLNYLWGQDQLPLEIYQARLYHAYYMFFAQQWQFYFIRAGQASLLHDQVALAHTVPVTVSILGTWFPGFVPNEVPILALHSSWFRWFAAKKEQGPVFVPVHARDGGPPAAAVLLMRSARRAVAEAPYHPDSYLVLYHACRILWKNQEDHWASDRGQSVRSMRSPLRRVQIIAALKTYLTLKPEDSQAHEQMAELYVQMRFFDVALEHLVSAHKYLYHRRPAFSEPNYVAYQKNLEGRVKYWENEVKKRRDDFDLRATGRGIVERYFLAKMAPYKSTDAANKEREERGMGLAQKALELLLEAEGKASQLNIEEKKFVAREYLMLQLHLGRWQEVGKALPNVQTLLGDNAYQEFQILWAAAAGNYELMEKALAEQTKLLGPPQTATNKYQFAALTWCLTPGLGGTETRAFLFYPFQLAPRGLYFQLIDTHRVRLQRAADLYLIRGLVALESGDTAAAARFFQKTLDLAGPTIFFPDRPIAARYLELINAGTK